MTLDSMLWRHDDSALEALTSKGLLRRAQRDLASGGGRIESVEAGRAVVAVGDLTVELDANGPAAAACNCKAHGVCRHILLAVLLLRAQREGADTPGAQPDLATAVTHICRLTPQEIAKFAGKDWDKALELSTGDLGVSFTDEGINITVRLSELNAAVTFIAGNDLKGAAYKGPRARQRLITTVGVLAVRQRQGLPTAESPPVASSAPGASNKFIDDAQRTIERAVSAALPSRSLLARDLLLDLAISSRCEALPRLAAELKSLAQTAQLANERSVAFEPGSFLLDAARSYALLEALRTNPGDARLGGSLRRNYERHPPLEVWPLGVARWRSRTGARGLSAYVLEPAAGRWLTLIEGRGAGADTAFDVRNAYTRPIWGAGTLSGLMGRRVRLSEPGIAHDGSISSTEAGGECLQAPLRPDEITSCPATHTRWAALKQDLASRMGNGVRRSTSPLPALIAPSEFGRLGFDDMHQRYRWELIDATGDILVLQIPAADEEAALRLWKSGKKLLAVVIEARLWERRLELRPVSVVFAERGGALVHNVDFDAWPPERGIERVLSRLKENLATPLAAAAGSASPVDRLVSGAAEELVGLLSGSTDGRADAMIRQLEALGLVTLARGLTRALGTKDPRALLKAAYLLGEVEAIRAFEAPGQAR